MLSIIEGGAEAVTTLKALPLKRLTLEAFFIFLIVTVCASLVTTVNGRNFRSYTLLHLEQTEVDPEIGTGG